MSRQEPPAVCSAAAEDWLRVADWSLSIPMVTELSAASETPYWYICNTNGPYYSQTDPPSP